MKIVLLFSMYLFLSIDAFGQQADNSNLKEKKGKIAVIDKSEKYTIVDDYFEVKQLFGDSITTKLKIESLHPLDIGSYIVSVSFYARWGIFFNEGVSRGEG